MSSTKASVSTSTACSRLCRQYRAGRTRDRSAPRQSDAGQNRCGCTAAGCRRPPSRGRRPARVRPRRLRGRAPPPTRPARRRPRRRRSELPGATGGQVIMACTSRSAAAQSTVGQAVAQHQPRAGPRLVTAVIGTSGARASSSMHAWCRNRPGSGPCRARVRNLTPSRVRAPRAMASSTSPSVTNSQRQTMRR